jgi:Na+-driven multidrug efflux pump
MVFSPFFMWNYVFNAFVRNDGAPSLAMTATICSSLFNIVMDYVLMFPLGLGMAGAALATAFSPIVGILICCIHFFKKENTICFLRIRPSFRRLIASCQLGISAFVGEISSGVITVVFNFIILGLVGNNGIAAFGVVTNTAIVATAIFNGISQGSQPLFSEYYGKNDNISMRKTLFLSIGTALSLAVLILLLIWILAPQLVAIFNSEQNAVLASYAIPGIRLYFIGFIFAGFNIVCTGYLGATEAALGASVTSLLRGFVAIIFFAGMRGMSIWLLFGITAPIYWCAMTYDKVFEKLEEMILENEQEEQVEEV